MRLYPGAPLVGLAGLLAVLSAMSLDRWERRPPPSPTAALDQATAEILVGKSLPPGFLELHPLPESIIALHHHIYAQVGERTWEESVKPLFYQTLLLRTIEDTGDPFPTPAQVLEWVRTHVAETEDILRDIGNRYSPVKIPRVGWREL